MLRIEGGGIWQMLVVAPRLTLRRSRESPLRHCQQFQKSRAAQRSRAATCSIREVPHLLCAR
jgi:hypothetical protein